MRGCSKLVLRTYNRAVDGVRVVIPAKDFRDPCVDADSLSGGGCGHVGEGEDVEQLVLGLVDQLQLFDEPALFGLDLRARVIGDQSDNGGWEVAQRDIASPIKRMEAGGYNLVGIADIVQPCRSDEFIAVRVSRGEFVSAICYAAHVLPPGARRFQ